MSNALLPPLPSTRHVQMKATRCRSKRPTHCRYHGVGVGHDAHRAIYQAMKSNAYKKHHVPTFKALKQYDGEHLASVIMQVVDYLPEVNSAKVKHAILLASRVHAVDSRANRAHHDRTPYIEHPLRNTLRIIRYGCTDEGVLIATILHDTVEDHPYEIAEDYAGLEPQNEEEARQMSLDYIKETYGEKVSHIVGGMSNPITPQYMPAAEKNIIYRDHVEEAIEDPGICVSKISDFKDNALSLHHTESGMSAVGLYKRATKYLLVIPVFRKRLQAGYVEGDFPISKDAIFELIREVDKGEERLKDIQERYAPQSN